MLSTAVLQRLKCYAWRKLVDEAQERWVYSCWDLNHSITSVYHSLSLINFGEIIFWLQ